MWRLFKMTPLQGEPARESNRTLYQPTSTWAWKSCPNKFSMNFLGERQAKFRTPSAVKMAIMAIGFHQKHVSIVSGVTRAPEAQTDHQLVLSCHRDGTGGPTKAGSFDMFLQSDFLVLPFHHVHIINVHYFHLWLATSLPKQITDLHGETIALSQPARHHTTQPGPSQKTKPHHLSASTGLANDPSYLSQSSVRGMVRIRNGVLKKWPPMKVLNPHHSVLMISCSNNKVISLPNTSMGWWLIYSELPGVRESFAQKPQWHPPKPQQSHLLHHGSTRVFPSKMLRTGNCWLSELR